jgi:hypothetical protein
MSRLSSRVTRLERFFSLPPASDSFFLSHPSLSFKSAGCQTADESEAGGRQKKRGDRSQTRDRIFCQTTGVRIVPIPAPGAEIGSRHDFLGRRPEV